MKWGLCCGASKRDKTQKCTGPRTCLASTRPRAFLAKSGLILSYAAAGRETDRAAQVRVDVIHNRVDQPVGHRDGLPVRSIKTHRPPPAPPQPNPPIPPPPDESTTPQTQPTT